MSPANEFATWPVERAGFAVVSADGILELEGDSGAFELASIAKLFAALTAMIALEEGSLDLAAPAGPDGATVRHLLAHASGLDFDGDRVVAPVGARRVYSNAGIEQYDDHLAKQTGMEYAQYLRLGILEPLSLDDTVLYGSPAHGMRSSVSDVARLAREFLSPTLVSAETLSGARTPVFPELSGVLPGIGRFDPNPFGLAVEVKGEKKPHWTGALTSPETFGHFGGAGTFLWVDPQIGVGAIALADRDFGPWAMRAWPTFNDVVVTAYRR